jgi:hypothetical protein
MLQWSFPSAQPAGTSKNSKSQITNIKQITMTKIQNSKSVLVI